MIPPDRHKHSMIIQRRSVLTADTLEKAYNTEERGEATFKNGLLSMRAIDNLISLFV
jgi:hypothetical protein